MIVILVFHDSNWSVSARTVYSLHTLHWYTARFQWVLVRSVTGRIENWKTAFRLPQQYRWVITDISGLSCSCGYVYGHNWFHQSLWSHSRGYCHGLYKVNWKYHVEWRLRRWTGPGLFWTWNWRVYAFGLDPFDLGGIIIDLILIFLDELRQSGFFNVFFGQVRPGYLRPTDCGYF